MKFSRCFVVFCTALALASCKIRISVPEGGSVTAASGAYHCDAGETCNIDVVDFYFDQTFVPKPAKGYKFKFWRKADRRFCGNVSMPCRVYTVGLNANKSLAQVMTQFFQSGEVFYLQPIFEKLNGEPPQATGYVRFSEGNPGREDDGVFVGATKNGFSSYALNADPKMTFGVLIDNENVSGGITITATTKLPSSLAYANIFYEFGYSGTNCLIQIHDNGQVRPTRANAEAAYFSNYVLANITRDVADEGSYGQGMRIVNPSGCGGAKVTKMFFSGLAFQHFGGNVIELDATIIDAGKVAR